MKKSIFAAALILTALPAQAQIPAPAAAPVPVVAPATAVPDMSAPAAAVAPAAPTSDWTQYKSPYAGEQNSLANPNRTNAEISAWTQKAVASALSFSPEDINQKIAEAKKLFVASGWTEYAAYVKQAQLVERVRNQKLNLATIMNGDVNVIGADVVGGTYHWLVRAPVMVTFFTVDAVTKEQKPAGTGKFTLTLQIGRVDKNLGDNGIAIEGWKIEAIAPTPGQ